jgi:hypothetical protein
MWKRSARDVEVSGTWRRIIFDETIEMRVPVTSVFRSSEGGESRSGAVIASNFRMRVLAGTFTAQVWRSRWSHLEPGRAGRAGEWQAVQRRGAAGEGDHPATVA